MKPKVTIIIPNYNHAKFIRKRLDSVFNQTFQDFEVILLDDASTDNSVEILEQYKSHPKISHFIVNKNNSGSPFKQWQRGIELAKGEFIWIAESDDYCELTFLEKLIPQIEGSIVLAYCASLIADENNTLLGKNTWAYELSKSKWLSNYCNVGSEEIKNYLRYRNTIPNASAVIFKKSVFETEMLNKPYSYCGDWNLWLELLKKGDISYLKDSLNYFRKHTNSTRVVQNLKKEQKRYEEYTTIICENSTFISRIQNVDKYYWLLQEWKWKRKYFKKNSFLTLKLPRELKLIYYLKNK